MFFREMPRNEKGVDYIVGDIHGCYTLFKGAIKEIEFNPAVDRMFCVGDLVDRGPQSVEALEVLKKPWFFATQGNHEQIFLNCVNPDGTTNLKYLIPNLRNGLQWITDTNRDILKELYEHIRELPFAMEVPTIRGTVGIVHAEVPIGMNWQTFKKRLLSADPKTLETAIWGRDRIEAHDRHGVEGIDRVFCGHTPQPMGPQRFGNIYYIDTGAFIRVKDDGGLSKLHGMTVAKLVGDTLTFSTLDNVRTERDGMYIKKQEGHGAFGQYAKPFPR